MSYSYNLFFFRLECQETSLPKQENESRDVKWFCSMKPVTHSHSSCKHALFGEMFLIKKLMNGKTSSS